MSISFKPNKVPSDVIARWPGMALELWKRSFTYQAAMLLTIALLIRFLPAWSTVVAFLIAPSLFLVAFATVQMTDENKPFSWRELLHAITPGVLKLGQISLKFAAIFGLVIAALAGLSATLAPDVSQTGQHDPLSQLIHTPLTIVTTPPENLFAEFLHFCATWTEGVMAMVFLGMFIVAIYQGIFGVILHAQAGMDARESRVYGWQAWQVNTASIEQAVSSAPAAFWHYLVAIIVIVICAFQTVYLSPVGLVLATYIPSLAFVAYRSIFLGKHDNVPVTARANVRLTGKFIPVPA